MIGRIVVAFTCLTLLLIASPAKAVVRIVVSDDGTALTVRWTGTLDTTGVFGTGAVGDADLINNNSEAIYSLNGPLFLSDGVGVLSGVDVVESATLPNLSSTLVVGGSFGFRFDRLYWDASLGDSPDAVSPDGMFTFSGETVSSVFGTNLDSGPVTLWTFSATGDWIEIALAPVPEPSRALLSIGGLVALIFWRRRA